MSEPIALPPPEPPPEQPAPPPAPTAPSHHVLAWLTGAGFLLLAAAIAWVWQHPMVAPPQTGALERQVAALEARVARLEQRPQAQPPDLGPLTARVAALEQRPPGTSAPATDLGPLTARVAALEQRPPAASAPATDLGPLTARVAALEQRPPVAPAPATDLGPLTGRVDALGQRQASDIASLQARVTALENSIGRTVRVLAARQALDAGHKLGNLPGAPPALAHFADTDPPTEASLRVAFPAAARAARAASRPATDGQPFLERMWADAQDLVTIRQGDRVIVGDPAAGLLDRARQALDDGDLAGAVQAVAALNGPAARAMAGWLAQARALLDARAALANWAAQG
jgi:hypothetical protein